MNLLKISDEYIQTAADFLLSSGLVKVLEKYGSVQYEGAYVGRVMLHGDIDIRVVREKEFSSDEMFAVLKDIHDTCSDYFRSYFVKGGWDDVRLGEQFPNGRYIGLKTYIEEERWKCDIWFVSVKESERDRQKLGISKIDLTEEQRKIILEFKLYRKENNLKVSGQEIYEAVLEKKMTDPTDYFKD